MNSQDLINGPLGISSVLLLSRLLSPQAGYRLAERVGRRLASDRDAALVRAVRCNQWVVSGCQASAADLDRLSAEVLVRHGRNLYDYYHHFHSEKATDTRVVIDDRFREVIENSRSKTRPQLLLMPHYANYELAARAASNHGLTMLVLSIPNPGRGYQWQNRLRTVHEIEVAPISFASLRQALVRLENGGTVFTGLDRPLEEERIKPGFFGHPSALPSGYIRLALKMDVPIQVLLIRTSPDGVSTMSVSDPVPLVHHPDPATEQQVNVERVLRVVEDHIRADPAQWSMFYPVWPDLLSATP